MMDLEKCNTNKIVEKKHAFKTSVSTTFVTDGSLTAFQSKSSVIERASEVLWYTLSTPLDVMHLPAQAKRKYIHFVNFQQWRGQNGDFQTFLNSEKPQAL